MINTILSAIIALLLIAAPVVAGQMSSQNSNLLELWHFNEGSGTTARDEINGKNITSISGAWVTGAYGSAIYSNGTQAMTVTTTSQNRVNMWLHFAVKITAAQSNKIIFKMIGTSGYWIGIWTNYTGAYTSYYVNSYSTAWGSDTLGTKIITDGKRHVFDYIQGASGKHYTWVDAVPDINGTSDGHSFGNSNTSLSILTEAAASLDEVSLGVLEPTTAQGTITREYLNFMGRHAGD